MLTKQERDASRTLVPQLLDALEAAERERDDLRKNSEQASALIQTTLKPIEGVVEALKFYAMDINWQRYSGRDAKLIHDDRGYRARAALKAAGVEQ